MKTLVLALVLLAMVGCTGLNTSTAVNVASDTTFALVLQNNPEYKPVVITALTEIKALLEGSLTYDDLMLAIVTKLPNKYFVVGIILSGYIEQDKPVFQTYLPMLDSYKIAVGKKIDRFLVLSKL